VPVMHRCGEKAPDLRNKSLTLVLADGAIAHESTQNIGAAPAQTPDNAALPFWPVVMMALIGGLILNLMPCVLPVLGM
ncbi:protein-disulfide reductase, partial [Salmonella enterica subsp. enterica serovar Weltevreden]|nr:protein-disulfide reductase [Salmonella enterica subsp. enterica serovar Weltevreden]